MQDRDATVRMFADEYGLQAETKLTLSVFDFS